MIVIRKDKELISTADWDAVTTMPGFTTNLDPAAHTLDSIIGRYLQPERVRCGLSNCHAPHGKGYFVVTKEHGQITNIGKDCGKNYFGVDFETMTRQFERDIQEKEMRERLFSFSFHTDELRGQVESLRRQDRGADWVYKLTRSLLEAGKGCPGRVVLQMASMVKTRRAVLTVEREATEEEAKRMEASQGRNLPRPVIVSESHGVIAGLEALYPENDLRQLLVLDIEEPLKRFEAEPVDTMTFERLRHWSRWSADIDAKLATATKSVENGRELLVPTNLAVFDALLNTDESVLFRGYLKTLPH